MLCSCARARYKEAALRPLDRDQALATATLGSPSTERILLTMALMRRLPLIVSVCALVAFGALTACNSSLAPRPDQTRNDEKQQGSSIFGGERGINLGKLMRGEGRSGGQRLSAVNKYLWRASLQTLSFLPIRFADPASGFIQTEWYQSSPYERLRVDVFVLSTELETEALEVAVHNQVEQNGAWISTQTDDSTKLSIENAILLRARQLRVADLRR